MKNIKNIFFLSFFFFLKQLHLAISHDCISMDAAKDIFYANANKPISLLNQNVTLEEAYCGQEKVNFLINRKYKDKIGYKVGFTSKKIQKMFDITEPATGVIYEHMFLENNSTLVDSLGKKVFIEPDFLVIVKSEKIMSAKTDLEILENLYSIHPFVEIISMKFDENKKVNGNMIIASNMLATNMVMGKEVIVMPNQEFLKKINNIYTVFTKNKKSILQEAPVSNLMGGPVNVLRWLIDDFNKKGIQLKKNDRISLGSIGNIFPLERNSEYVYEFRGLEGKVSLNINVD